MHHGTRSTSASKVPQSSPLNNSNTATFKGVNISQFLLSVGVFLAREGRLDEEGSSAHLGGGVGGELVKIADRVGQIEPGRQARAIGQLEANGDGGLAVVDVGRSSRGGRGASCCSNRTGLYHSRVSVAWHGATKPMPLTAKRPVDTGKLMPVLLVLLQAHITSLAGLDLHEMQGGTTGTDHLQVLSVLGIFVAAHRTIFNREAIGPEVQNACDDGELIWSGAGRDLRGDLARLGAIAAHGGAAAAEV